MNIFKTILAATTSLVPMLAIAHSGHGSYSSSFLNGFIHPFTGLDHFMMLLAFGVLIWIAHRRWKVTGLMSLLVAMLIGFSVGSQAMLPTTIAEMGIVISLVLLALALLIKAHKAVPVFAVLLASFHGVAHGLELAQGGSTVLLMLGMISAMSLIYIVGLALGAFIQKYVPYGKQIIAALTAIVAIVSLV